MRVQRCLVVMLTLALGLAPAASAMAATYYVDNQSAGCSNAGAGTEAQPYCTIGAAVAAHAGAGNTIIVKPGIYREQVSIPASGASGSPFVIQAQGPGVVIDGADDFSGAGLWAQPGPQTVETDHGLAANDDPWLATNVTWAPRQVFVGGRRLMPSTASPELLPPGTFTWVAGDGLYVNLDGTNPGLQQVMVGRRNYGFSMNARSWVTIDGFEITRSDLRGINIGAGCSDVVVSDHRVTHSAGYGIQAIGSARITIEGNIVSDGALHGIGATQGSSACVIRNNESFRNADPDIRRANGIYLHGSTGTTLYGNRLHDNQDSGVQFSGGANNSISYNNRSWNNGDHGYDHLDASGTVHVNDIASGNLKDGFSIEGDSPNTQMFNCIGVNNGTTTDEFNLWVNDPSSVGFVSDYNIFWNANDQEPFKFGTTKYATLAAYQAASGQDAHSRQADPKFVNGPAGDFTLAPGSPGIDAGTAAAPSWPPTDVTGHSRVDDPMTANSGTGPVVYADIGVFEYIPSVDRAPVVSSPGSLRRGMGTTVTFTVTASDPDGQPIESLVMVPVNMPSGHTATFTTNASKTSGTFSWKLPYLLADWRVRFVATNSLSGSSETIIRARLLSESGNEPVVVVEGGTDAAAGAAGDAVPSHAVAAELSFSNAFPNPARGPVEFALDAPRDAEVRWAVFDLQGRMLWSEERTIPAGRTQLRWDGNTSSGTQAATGIYLVRAMVDGARFSRRVVRF